MDIRVPRLSGVRFLSVAQAFALFATSWFVWLNFVGPRLARQSLAAVLADALGYVLIVWGCTAAITFCVYLVISLADMNVMLRASVRSSAVSMWFAPAIILLSVHDPIPYTASLILVVNTTRLLIARWMPEPGLETSLAESVRWPVFVASFTIQASLIAMLWGYPLLAAACCAASAAILTTLWIAHGAYSTLKPPALPQSMFSIALTMILALAATVGVYSGIRATADGSAGSPSTSNPGAGARDLLRRILTTQDADPKAEPEPISPAKFVGLADGSFPGVILHPEVKPHTTLVPPPRLSLGHGAMGSALVQPLIIPFTGEYWLFRPPFSRPPWTSFSQAGSPLRLSFMTTDHRQLAMEAYQGLDSPIDPSCCRKVQLAISNADRSGSVSLELILVRTHGKGERNQGLGAAAVGLDNHQVLDFTIPKAPSLPEFDGLRVVFHRDPYWANRSAKIEIDRFILLPAAW